jgi:hypothetical protein
VVYGGGLEIRERLSHPSLLDTILCCPVGRIRAICIWLCHPVPLGAKQFVGKMSAKWWSYDW